MLVKIAVCFHSASCSHSKREPLPTMHGMLVKGLSKWDCIYSLFWILLFSKMALRTELRNSIEKAPLHSSGFFNVPGYAIACLPCAGSAYLCLCQVSVSPWTAFLIPFLSSMLWFCAHLFIRHESVKVRIALGDQALV